LRNINYFLIGKIKDRDGVKLIISKLKYFTTNVEISYY
jgi:hypothetical protein